MDSTPITDLQKQLAEEQAKAAELEELQAAPGRIAKLKATIAAALKRDTSEAEARRQAAAQAEEELRARAATFDALVDQLPVAAAALRDANQRYYGLTARRDVPGVLAVTIAIPAVIDGALNPAWVSRPRRRISDYLPAPVSKTKDADDE